jgi:hypothetical protein
MNYGQTQQLPNYTFTPQFLAQQQQLYSQLPGQIPEWLIPAGIGLGALILILIITR